MTKASKVLDRIISLIICAGAFLIPIFFLPITTDIVEFNKQYLLYFFTIVGIFLWIVKGLIDKKLTIRRTPFDLPFLFVFVFLLISTLLSKNRILSFWGDVNSLSNAFVPMVFYFLFYFLILNNVHSLKQVIKVLSFFVGSGVISALYFINQSLSLVSLSNLPVPRWVIASDLPTHYGYFLVIVLMILFAIVMTKKKSFWSVGNILGILGGLVIFTALLMLGFKSVWIITAIAIFLLLVFTLSKIEEIAIPWISIAFGIMILSILFILLGTPSFLVASLPTEVALSPGVSWTITTASLSENLKSFLLGSGPSTFVYDFSAFRPEAFNSNFAWSLRFNRPHDTVLNILVANGVLGALSWIGLFLVVIGTFFVMWFTKSVKLKKKVISKMSDMMQISGEFDGDYPHSLFAGLISAWLVLFVSMFFITFTTVHWLLFFSLLALTFLVGTGFSNKEIKTFTLSLKTMPQYTLISSFINILVFAVILVLAVFLGRFYGAEVYRANSTKYTAVGNHTKAASAMFKAISLNPNYAKYYLELSSAYIGMATVESQKEAPDGQRVANLVASAVNQAREATRLAPNDASAWDFLASMYVTARPLTSNANTFIISSLEKAIELEKTNPRLYLDLARARSANNDLQGAREALELSIKLKPNYILAYTSLTQLDEAENKINEAIEHASVAAALSQTDPSLLFNLGRLYYNRAQTDDLARAEQLFVEAIRLNPNYADALWSLAVLYERQGKLNDALQLYKMVEQLNPNNQGVKDKINRLLGL